MSDRLHEVAQHIADHGLDADSWFTLRETAAESLKDTDSPRIIRKLSELEALDPDTALMQHQKGYRDSYIDYQRMWVKECEIDSTYIFPLVVMMDGAQVRAAREAMEQEYGAD